MKFYKVIRFIFSPLFKLIFRIHTHGEENIPAEGGLLICPNHISAMDVIVLTSATKKRQIRYMAKAELFKIPVLSWIIKAMGAFPIKRGEGDVAAIKKTIGLLKEGQTVGMFPQGTRYKGVHPKTSKVKPGAGMIAHRSSVPVLPVAIITKNYKLGFLRRTDVVFGKPIYPADMGFESGNRAEQQVASELIFERMLELHEVKK